MEEDQHSILNSKEIKSKKSKPLKNGTSSKFKEIFKPQTPTSKFSTLKTDKRTIWTEF